MRRYRQLKFEARVTILLAVGVGRLESYERAGTCSLLYQPDLRHFQRTHNCIINLYFHLSPNLYFQLSPQVLVDPHELAL